jgi:ribosomal protein L37AE/L43A
VAAALAGPVASAIFSTQDEFGPTRNRLLFVQRAAKKLIGVSSVLVVVAAVAIVISIRAIRTEVDHSVAQIRENHVCPHCGYVFLLSVAEAAAMRRSHGDIICPKCGKPGAIKEVSANAGVLVNDKFPQPPNAEEPSEANGDAGAPRKKPPALAPNLTKPKRP